MLPTTSSSVGIAGSYCVPGASSWAWAESWMTVANASVPSMIPFRMSYEEDGQYSQDMVCARYSASESRAKIPFCSKTLPTQSVVCVHWGPLLGLFGPAVSDIASRRERKIVGPALGLHGYSSRGPKIKVCITVPNSACALPRSAT